MDAAGPRFRALTAKLDRVTYTAVIEDKSEESGTFRFQRGKGKEFRAIFDIERPDRKVAALSDGKAEIYNPKVELVQVFDLSKHKALVDQFLLLGFGTTGTELVKNYSVKVLGPDSVAGAKATRLELIPKSAQVKQHLTKIEIWIADGAAHAIQQKLFEPSGNYQMATYTAVQVNPELKPGEVRLVTPPGVKREIVGR
jgi:outer membrane lipoprotein-sorting protein